MKPSKVAAQNSGQNKEDCGVWLDTVQLKEKAKKKRSARPISKLLNPLADGAGYNVAVALNFTQTKMEMPKTKQSSISNFFTGQRRVLHKMSTTGGLNTGAQEACFPSAFSSVMTNCATPELCDFDNELQWCDAVYKQGNDHLTEPEPLMWWEKEDEESHASSRNIISDFREESSGDKSPLMKKETFERTSPSDNCDQHDVKTQSQNSVHKDAEPNFLRSPPSPNEFNLFGESLLDAEGRTSTQKTSKGLSLQNDKENTIPKSPKTMPDSQIQIISKNTKLEPLHLKEGSLNSPFKWTKPRSSPRKKLKLQSFRDESDDENFSMLFTQDSQGLRVIAHRGPQTRSPFKDQSNVSVHLPNGIKCLEEHEDEEMLFTQDSQGNMVIKH